MKKSESEKPGLKLSIQKAKVTASGPITSRQIEGENVEAVTIIPPPPHLGFKITVDCGCSHEIKRHLLLGRKTMSKIDSVLKAEILLC